MTHRRGAFREESGRVNLIKPPLRSASGPLR